MEFKTLNKNKHHRLLYISTVDITKSGSNNKLLGVCVPLLVLDLWCSHFSRTSTLQYIHSFKSLSYHKNGCYGSHNKTFAKRFYIYVRPDISTSFNIYIYVCVFIYSFIYLQILIYIYITSNYNMFTNSNPCHTSQQMEICQ